MVDYSSTMKTYLIQQDELRGKMRLPVLSTTRMKIKRFLLKFESRPCQNIKNPCLGYYRGVGVTQLISATALLCKLLQAPKFQGYSIYRKLLIVHFMNRVVTDSYKMDKKVNTIRQLCKVLILLKKTPRSLGIIYLGENHIFLV